MGQKMRRLAVDGEHFVWRRRHRHRDGCVEELTVVRSRDEGSERLCLRFREQDGWRPGDFEAGVLARGAIVVNLNRPAVVAALVREARRRGWISEHPRMDVESPYDWLAEVTTGR